MHKYGKYDPSRDYLKEAWDWVWVNAEDRVVVVYRPEIVLFEENRRFPLKRGWVANCNPNGVDYFTDPQPTADAAVLLAFKLQHWERYVIFPPTAPSPTSSPDVDAVRQ
jgi:hypothetical protein